MTYILDTNICIYIINTKPANVLDRFRQEEIGNIAISSVTAAELSYGVAKSESARNRQALEKFFVPLDILPLGKEAIWEYGNMRAILEKKGKVIGALDMLIAAHVLSLDAVLITNNAKEFSRVPNLRLENWT
jgi:tRNA(fMet)-specific endonuclease VapC